MQPMQDTGAVFDVSQQYRYSLWRLWNRDLPRVAFVMLNPSQADAIANDPTIRRCLQFAQSWGFGSVEVVNLFAYRTPYPTELKQARDPVGPENDRYLQLAATHAKQIILAWGNAGSLLGRDRTVLQLLTSHPSLHCLGVNQSGQPRHPLYVRSNITLSSWTFELEPSNRSTLIQNCQH